MVAESTRSLPDHVHALETVSAEAFPIADVPSSEATHPIAADVVSTPHHVVANDEAISLEVHAAVTAAVDQVSSSTAYEADAADNHVSAEVSKPESVSAIVDQVTVPVVTTEDKGKVEHEDDEGKDGASDSSSEAVHESDKTDELDDVSIPDEGDVDIDDSTNDGKDNADADVDDTEDKNFIDASEVEDEDDDEEPRGQGHDWEGNNEVEFDIPHNPKSSFQDYLMTSKPILASEASKYSPTSPLAS